MGNMLKISPAWDEVAGEFIGTVRGFKEWGPIHGGPTREAFEQAVADRLQRLNPPRVDFAVEWPGEVHEFRPGIAA
jgi:hypothetical protein